MKRLLAYLLVKEKALWKSATFWVSALIMSLPDILRYLQDNASTVAGYLPHAWADPSIRLIGVVVFLARMKSLVKVPPDAPLPPPVPR